MQNVLAVITTLVALAAGAGLVWLLRRMGKSDAAARMQANAADNAEWGKIKQWLDASLFGLVTLAERSFGDGTGKLKLSA